MSAIFLLAGLRTSVGGLEAGFYLFFTGHAFECECFQTLAEVGRGLCGDCGSAVCLLSLKRGAKVP